VRDLQQHQSQLAQYSNFRRRHKELMNIIMSFSAGSRQAGCSVHIKWWLSGCGCSWTIMGCRGVAGQHCVQDLRTAY
jgi:hypothetical protein